MSAATGDFAIWRGAGAQGARRGTARLGYPGGAITALEHVADVNRAVDLHRLGDGAIAVAPAEEWA